MSVLRIYRFNKRSIQKAEGELRALDDARVARYFANCDSDPAIRAAIRDEQRVRDDAEDDE